MGTKVRAYLQVHFEFIKHTDNYQNGRALRVFLVSVSGKMRFRFK